MSAVSGAFRRAFAWLDSFWGGADLETDRDRFRVWTARAIVVVSILGALVAWQASQQSEDADDLEQQALRESNFEALARDGLRAALAHDLRLVGEFEESWERARLIDEALESQPDSPELRLELLRQTRRHETLRQFFYAAHPSAVTAGGGKVVYGPDAIAEFQESNNPTLEELRPEQAEKASEEGRSTAVGYVRSAALLAAALFFLTLAMLTGLALRGKMAAAGVALALVAVVQFVVA